jgi:hypothetical protein
MSSLAVVVDATQDDERVVLDPVNKPMPLADAA